MLQRLAQTTAQDQAWRVGASFGVADCPLRDSQLGATLVRAVASWYAQLRLLVCTAAAHGMWVRSMRVGSGDG